MKAFKNIWNRYISDSSNNREDIESNMSKNSIESTDYFNAKNLKGKTTLHKAVDNDNEKLVDDLIKHKANLDIIDDNGNTAIHIAAEKDNDILLNKLIKAGAKTDIKNNMGETALHRAVKAGKISNIDLLIQTYKKLIDIPSSCYISSSIYSGFPIHYSLKYYKSEDFLEIFKTLISNGANINSKDIYDSTTLYLLISHEKINLFDIEFINQLFEKSDLETIKKNHVIIHAAILNRNITKEVFELILSKCFKQINHIDNLGNSPITYAAQIGNLDIVKSLIEAGSDLGGKQGELAVKTALLNNNIECLIELIEAGANPDVHIYTNSYVSSLSYSSNKEDKTGCLRDGDTPLHFAVITENKELAESCINRKPQMINSQNEKGMSPCSYAIKVLSIEMARILSNAEIDIEDKLTVSSILPIPYLNNDIRYNSLIMQGASRGMKTIDEVERFFNDTEYQLSEQQLKKREEATLKYNRANKDSSIIYKSPFSKILQPF